MPAPAERNEDRTRELVARLQAGEAAAWDELYRVYHDELLFTVRMSLGARLRSVLESEDVLQSVALAAFRALPAFEYRGVGSLRAFLHKLVLNKIRDRADTFSAQKRAGAVPLTDSVADRLHERAPVDYSDSSEYRRLEQALAQLPPDMREVILLRKLEGLTGEEAAQRLARSDVATRKLFSRAMARLALALAADAP